MNAGVSRLRTDEDQPHLIVPCCQETRWVYTMFSGFQVQCVTFCCQCQSKVASKQNLNVLHSTTLDGIYTNPNQCRRLWQSWTSTLAVATSPD